MAIVAWIIVLITGKLPDSLHQAYTAVFRYQVRQYCYQYLLTPTYPVRGLFGDHAAMAPAPPAGSAESAAAPISAILTANIGLTLRWCRCVW